MEQLSEKFMEGAAKLGLGMVLLKEELRKDKDSDKAEKAKQYTIEAIKEISQLWNKESRVKFNDYVVELIDIFEMVETGEISIGEFKILLTTNQPDIFKKEMELRKRVTLDSSDREAVEELKQVYRECLKPELVSEEAITELIMFSTNPVDRQLDMAEYLIELHKELPEELKFISEEDNIIL